MPRRATYQYLTLFVVSLLVRGGLLWWYFPPEGWKDLEFGFELGRVAAHIATGDGMSSPFEDGRAPTAWFMPAVPLIWARLFSFFGVFSPASLVAIYSFNTVAFALTSCCYLYLLRHIVPDGRSRWLPLVAVLVSVLLPEHFVTLTRPWYWSIQNLGVSVMLICALKLSEAPSTKLALLLGLASGLTFLVNSVPAILFGALLLRGVITAHNRLRALSFVAISLVAATVILTPWLVRNYDAFGAFVPFRQNTWVEIRQGNSERGIIIQGVDSLHPNVDAKERQLYREIGERAYEERARVEAAAYVRTHPVETAKRTFLRATFFWLSELFHEGVYGDKTWQTKSARERVRDIFVALFALLPPLIVLVALFKGWLSTVPQAWLLKTVLLTLPLPYYITHIHPVYFSSVRGPLLMLVVVAVGERWRAMRVAK